MTNTPEDTLILDTTRGPVKIALRTDLAPGHCARIKELARKGFYDGVVFHRVIDGFMAQTGDANFLDGNYTVWGRVIEGMENVDKITRGEPPAKPDKIVSMKVAAAAA